MGGLIKTLFGGSDNQSQQQSQQSSSSSSQSNAESGNNAFAFLKDTLSPQVGTGTAANSTIAALLGQGGDKAAAEGAFNNYLGSTGYNFMLDQGSKAITGNAAARGLLKSGSTGKGLTTFGQNIGQNYFNNFLQQMQGLVGNGNAAAGQIGNAGQFSRSSSTQQSQSQGTSSGTSSGSSQNGIIPSLFG